MEQYILVIDLDRCIGCRGGCQAACKNQHQTELGNYRSRLITVGPTGTYPDLEMYFIPVMCQQCENPSCVQACPAGACEKGEHDGVIRVDKETCIGCQKCVRACPYNAIIYDKEIRKVEKCDLCSELRGDGETPVCVKNCAGKAIYYGDINDTDSEVSRIIREAGEHVYALCDTGNNPRVRYILRKAGWQNLSPEEFL